MKKLRKFAALLLAGAMAMVMFTACSGSGGGSPASFEQQVENAFFAAYSRETGLTTNDPEVKALAETSFDCIKKEDGNFYFNLTGIPQNRWAVIDKENDLITYALPIPDPDADTNAQSHYKVLEVTPETLRTLNADALSNPFDPIQSGSNKDVKITAIGVAVKTINGKTYVSLGARVETDLSNSQS